MGRFRPLARLAAVAVLALALGGCAIRPPEWEYFDADRHPVGGTAAVTGYYAGAFVVYPVTLLLLGTLYLITGNPEEARLLFDFGVQESRVGPSIFGVATGAVLGSPFHLVALPFEGRTEEPESAEEGRKLGPADGP